MIKFKKYLEEVNEGKIVLKRRYTENYPEKNVNNKTTVRNAIIEALRDKKLTLSEFKEIVSQHSKSPNKWTQRNKRFFTIEEDNVSLSKYGAKILDSLEILLKEGAVSEIQFLSQKNKVIAKNGRKWPKSFFENFG